MAATMLHRGPDDEGISNNEHNDFVFGHRRLALIDLSEAGHQPMYYQNLSIVFNGEIYNFQEIKIELKTLGYNFDTDSDTEVIIKSYDAWGIKFVDRFKGMFAFAIWDKTKAQLILVRDRVGVKPLFYLFHDS